MSLSPFSSRGTGRPHRFLLRAGTVFFCLLFLSACSDFADIFRRQGKVYRKSSPHEKGRQVASKKNRKGNGQVVHGFFIWPVDGEIGSNFGMRNGRPHDGVDIRAQKGTPIHASAAGEVVYAGQMSSYGNLILIRHRDNYFTAYAHNEENLVEEGKKVEQGDLIAKVGDTGNATGYHVHFEIRDGSTPMDPMLFLPDSGGPVLVKKSEQEEKPMEGSPPIEAPKESEAPGDPAILY
jgi:murein DD-endopeptidase MepM/ murein hydrolase activator NlpD